MLASELSARTAIVTTMKSVTGIGAVYPRFRRPLKEGTAAEYGRLFVDQDGRINFWMVRRVQRAPVLDNFNRIVSVIQVYALIGHYGVVDNDDDGEASEAQFQLEIEAIADALAANSNLGLDGVSHRNLAVPVDIDDRYLGDYLCHYVECRLVVDVEDC